MLVTGLGKKKIILGFPWLNDENPDIKWKSGEFKWQPQPFKVKRVTGIWPLDLAKTMARQALTTIMEEKDGKERLNQTLNPLPETDLAALIATITDDPEDYLWINAKSTNATTIQAEIKFEETNCTFKRSNTRGIPQILGHLLREKHSMIP